MFVNGATDAADKSISTADCIAPSLMGHATDPAGPSDSTDDKLVCTENGASKLGNGTHGAQATLDCTDDCATVSSEGHIQAPRRCGTVSPPLGEQNRTSDADAAFVNGTGAFMGDSRAADEFQDSYRGHVSSWAQELRRTTKQRLISM